MKNSAENLCDTFNQDKWYEEESWSHLWNNFHKGNFENIRFRFSAWKMSKSIHKVPKTIEKIALNFLKISNSFVEKKKKG